MDKKEIEALLLKYKKGECTEKEIAKIHIWYENLNAQSALTLSRDEKNETEERILRNLLSEVRPPQASEGATRRSWWRSGTTSAAAAAIIIAIGCWVFLDKNDLRDVRQADKILMEIPSAELVTETNHAQQPKKIVLKDGSTVTLAPGSEIIYPTQFKNDKREVQLIGDAFFEITKNPDKPFFVYSGKLVTRVLGTSFRIKTNARDQALEVEVVTGKVSVFENANAFEETIRVDPSNGVVLTPNQRVTYFAESRHLMTGLVVEPVKATAVTDESRLVFNDVPLGKIAAALHTSYGIEIVFASDRLANCTFTGDITGLPLYEKLDLLCGSVGADYEIKGTRILINGQGCD